jgi:hypothetical protein
MEKEGKEQGEQEGGKRREWRVNMIKECFM